MSPAHKQFVRRYLFSPGMGLVLSVLMFSLGPSLIKMTLDSGMPPITLALIRLTIASFVLLPVVWQQHRTVLSHAPRRVFVLAILAGFAIATNYVTMMWSLDRTSIMINQVIVNSSPIWVGILEVAILGARFSRFMWAGLGLSIIGGLVIAMGSVGENAAPEAALGNFLALIAALALAVYFIAGRSARKHITFIPYVWIVYTAGAIGVALALFFSNGTITGYTQEAYLWALTVTVVPQLIGHTMLNYAVGYFPATFASLSGQTVVVFSSIIAFILFAQIPTIAEVIGGVIIVTGVIIAVLAQQRRSAAKRKSQIVT